MTHLCIPRKSHFSREYRWYQSLKEMTTTPWHRLPEDNVPAMIALMHLLSLLRSVTAQRNKLVLENAALRHQLAVLKRSVKRPQIKDSDRIFWIMMHRLLKDWKDALLFVKPCILGP